MSLIFEQPTLSEYFAAWSGFSGHFTQHPAWASFKAKSGLRSFWMCGKDAGEIVIAGQGFLTPCLGKYYAYFPYGPFVNPNKISSQDVTDFAKAVSDAFGCPFTRIEPGLGWVPGLETQAKSVIGQLPKSTLVINTTLGEILLKNMHQKTRYNIGLAQRHGCHVRKLHISEWREGVNLIEETAKRQGYKDHGADYYSLLLNFGQEQGEVGVSMNGAYYDGKLLAVGIFVDCFRTRTYLFGGSLETHRNVMAPYLLHWKSILEAGELGLSYYDFWGLDTSSEKEAGFTRFKQGFGGEVLKFNGAVDFTASKAWYALYSRLRRFART